jgi:hypothetical protein
VEGQGWVMCWVMCWERKGHAEWRRRRADRLKGQNADRKGRGAGHPGTKEAGERGGRASEAVSVSSEQ